MSRLVCPAVVLLVCLSAACRYQPLEFRPDITDSDGADGADGGGDPTDPDPDSEGDSDPGDSGPPPCECASHEVCVDDVCNGAPVVDIPSSVVLAPGDQLTLEATVIDPEGDALTITWSVSACAPTLDISQEEAKLVLEVSLDSLPGECQATLSVSDDHQTVVRVVEVTVAPKLVGTFVDSGVGCLEDAYDPYVNAPQGTLAKPWCTLSLGLEAARALNAPVVYVSTALQQSGDWLEVDAQDVEVIGGYEVASGSWVHQGARTPVHIQADADLGWKLWDYEPEVGARPKIILRHFELYRSSRCPSYCALISIEDVEATLDDVVLGEPGPTMPFERSSSATFVGLSIEGKDGTQGTKATVQHSIIHGARAVDANFDGYADNPTKTSYGIWAGPTAGAPLELVLEDTTVHGGEASKLAAALHTTGVTQATVERSVLSTQTAMLDGERGMGWLDGTNALFPTPDEPCYGTAPCGGSSVVSISSSTVIVDGYAVAVGLAAQGTKALSVSSVDARVTGEVFAGGLWTVGAGSGAGVAVDGDSSFDVSALARRSYADWDHTGAAGVMDGLFDDDLGAIELVGSKDVAVTGASVAVDVRVGAGMPRVAAGVLLVGTESAQVDGVAMTVAGTRNGVGSPAGVATVAGVWTLWTQDVLVRRAAIALAPNLAVNRVAPLMDGAPYAGSGYLQGSSGLTWSANTVTSVLDGTSLTTRRSCALAMSSQGLAVENNTFACELVPSDPGEVPQLWLLQTKNAVVLGNTLSGQVSVDAPTFTVIGLRDGEGTNLASPAAGSMGLGVERNVVRLTALAGRSAAVGMWLGAESYATPVANNALVLMGADVAAGLRVTGSAQVALHHNTVRLGATVATLPNGAAAAIHVVVPAVVNDRKVAIANNILELADRQKAYHVLEQARQTSSRLYVYAGNLLLGPSAPAYPPSPYAYTTGMDFPPSGTTLVSLGSSLEASLDAASLEQAPDNTVDSVSPFCAELGAFHVVRPVESPYTVSARVPQADIDAEQRDGTPCTGADQFVDPGICP